MPSNDVFFTDQSEQSAVKAQIVSSYFSAWSRVIQKWNPPMAYIDLFCGPGKYENDKPSAPLLIIQSTLANPALLNKMNFVFNDKDPNNIAMLMALFLLPVLNASHGETHFLYIPLSPNSP